MELFYLMEKKFTYGKEEKLKGRKIIQKLFAEGKSFCVFPLKIFYLEIKETIDFPAKIGVGVSVKNFKKAVERNRIKRLLREAYRTEKFLLHRFLKEENKNVAVFFLYIDKALPEENNIRNKMPFVLKKLVKALNEKDIADT